MTADYQSELDFTIAFLNRLRVSVHILDPMDTEEILDIGMRAVLGISDAYETPYRTAFMLPNQQAIYKIMDRFMCNYIFFHLPGTEKPAAAVIGPYLTVDPTRELLMEQSVRLSIPMQHINRITEYYASLPVFHDPSPILAAVTCLGMKMWKDESAFDIVDVNHEQAIRLPGERTQDAMLEQTDVLLHMKQIEERYAFENELMEIVSKGLTNRAEVMMSGVSQTNFQSHAADPLRNMKNYCIICNTLMRKAAQQGGVHPVHLDDISGQYARQIERVPTVEKAGELLGAMIRAYSRLVRTHKSRNYSAVIQNVVTYIDANLSGELSLTGIARQMRISPGYLSTLFHRETGRTLAEYITAQRMKTALHLLRSTKLQVQAVAQLSGFSDPNYFGKQFKKYYGITPLQYRKDHYEPADPIDKLN